MKIYARVCNNLGCYFFGKMFCMPLEKHIRNISAYLSMKDSAKFIYNSIDKNKCIKIEFYFRRTIHISIRNNILFFNMGIFSTASERIIRKKILFPLLILIQLALQIEYCNNICRTLKIIKMMNIIR